MEEDYDEGNEDEEKFGFFEDAPSPSITAERILDINQISRLQSQVIQETADLLQVSLAEASCMLRHFSCPERSKVRRDTGLRRVAATNLGQSSKRKSEQTECVICFEQFPFEETACALCYEHFFCRGCWEGYLTSAIEEGSSCIRVRCPQPRCGAAVLDETILSLLPEEEYAKFRTFVLTSFVETCVDMKWCPAPGCQFAVGAPSGARLEVTCKCSEKFCWGCVSEIHPSVSCELAMKWKTKHGSDQENDAWLAGRTKPCPKCKKVIEKVEGCQHMTCTCNYHFCWTCLRAWSGHKDSSCYRLGREPGAKDRRQARVESTRYEHFCAGFDAQDKAMKLAQGVVNNNISEMLDELSRASNRKRNELDCIADAWKEIVNSRRVLKWSYVYGYYLCCEEGDECSKIPLFKHLQDEAATSVDRLQGCAEKESAAVLDNFLEYQFRLTSLTRQTKNFMERLAESLEDELDEVDVAVRHLASLHEISL